MELRKFVPVSGMIEVIPTQETGGAYVLAAESQQTVERLERELTEMSDKCEAWRIGYDAVIEERDAAQQQVAQLREEVTKAGKDYEACRDSLDRTVLAHTTLRGLVAQLPDDLGAIEKDLSPINLGEDMTDREIEIFKRAVSLTVKTVLARIALPREGGAQELTVEQIRAQLVRGVAAAEAAPDGGEHE